MVPERPGHTPSNSWLGEGGDRRKTIGVVGSINFDVARRLIYRILNEDLTFAYTLDGASSFQDQMVRLTENPKFNSARYVVVNTVSGGLDELLGISQINPFDVLVVFSLDTYDITSARVDGFISQMRARHASGLFNGDDDNLYRLALILEMRGLKIKLFGKFPRNDIRVVSSETSGGAGCVVLANYGRVRTLEINSDIDNTHLVAASIGIAMKVGVGFDEALSKIEGISL
jgi:hypothetical protein